MIDWAKVRSFFRVSEYKCTLCGSRNTVPMKNSSGSQLYCYDTYHMQEKLMCYCRDCDKEFKYPLGHPRHRPRKPKEMYGEVNVVKVNKS